MLTRKWSRQDEFDTLLYGAAARHGVTPTLLKAVCATESGFNPRAYREEPARASLPPTPDFPQGGDASFGLMQVLARTARSLGYAGTLDGLFDAATSLDLGAKYLGQQLRRYNGSVPDAAAAYNAGSARHTTSSTYINQAYVDKVLANLNYFQQWEAQKGRATGTPVATFPDERGNGSVPDDQHRPVAGDPGTRGRASVPVVAWKGMAVGGGLGLGLWAVILWVASTCKG